MDPLDLPRSDEGGQTSECFDDRCEGQSFATADRDTATLEDQGPSLARKAFDFVDEAGLAHSGIAADEGDDRVAGRCLDDDVVEGLELMATADELGACDSRGHGSHRTGGHQTVGRRRPTWEAVDQAAEWAVPEIRPMISEIPRRGRLGSASVAAALVDESAASSRAFASARRMVSSCWLKRYSKSASIL